MLIGQKSKRFRIEKGISLQFFGDEQEQQFVSCRRIRSGLTNQEHPKLILCSSFRSSAYIIVFNTSFCLFKLKYQIYVEPIYGEEENTIRKKACLEEVINTLIIFLRKDN